MSKKLLEENTLISRAKKLAECSQAEQTTGQKESFLGILISGERYLIPADMIEEVVPITKLSLLPRQKKALNGTIALRGNLFLVGNLSHVLGFKKTEPTKASSIVLVRTGKHVTGFLVDQVLSYEECDAGREESGGEIKGGSDGLTCGQVKIENEWYVRLNLESILQKFESELSNQRR